MDSKDLEYIYDNITYGQMNIYNDIKTINTMEQYITKAENLGFNYSIKNLKKGFKQLDMLRKDDTLIGSLRSPVYPSNSAKGRKVSISTIETEKILTLADIRTTISKVYKDNEMKKDKIDSFKNFDDTVVIKPNNMSLGRGVYVNISADEFEKFWNLTRNTMIKHGRKQSQSILVQNYLKGFEARATIIEGKFNSIVARVPAYVRGDGENTISDLINLKNTERKKCAHLSRKLIKSSATPAMESFLEYSGYTLDSVPDNNEYVLLLSVSNTSLGGEMVDITNFVSSEIKEIAVDALAALPDMPSGGVDIMMENFEDKNPAVIEINAFPMLQSTIYPTYGPSTDPQAYFLNSYYARDQFLNDVQDKYKIENENEYIRNYLLFQEKQKYFRSLIDTNAVLNK